MNLICRFLILFLTLSITSENKIDEYSIEPVKDALKKEGIFQVIESIKRNYGQDVAIISCEELTESRKGNCKRLVTEYITPSPKFTHSTHHLHFPTSSQDLLQQQSDTSTKSGKKVSSTVVGSTDQKSEQIKSTIIYSDNISKLIYKYHYIMWRIKLNNTKKKSDMIYGKIIKRVKDLSLKKRFINNKNIKDLKKILNK